jgi:hypothetical protein
MNIYLAILFYFIFSLAGFFTFSLLTINIVSWLRDKVAELENEKK